MDDSLLAGVTATIVALDPSRRLLVAVDGVDGAGKTTFADALAVAITSGRTPRPVVRASVDDFHRPAEQRYRRGRNSPDGYYLDSYDYAALASNLLDPFRADGECRYRTEVFDVAADQRVDGPRRLAAPSTVLLIDGIFLHRSELAGCWDYSIFLAVDFAVSVPRGAARGPGWGSSDPQAPSNRRYVDGQRRYLREVAPAQRADLVIDYTDLTRPVVLSRRATNAPAGTARSSGPRPRGSPGAGRSHSTSGWSGP